MKKAQTTNSPDLSQSDGKDKVKNLTFKICIVLFFIYEIIAAL